MKIQNSILFVFFFVFACDDSVVTENEKDLTGQQNEQTSYPLRLDQNYAVNMVSGDSIHPIINSFGDTVLTGIAFPILGKQIWLDSIDPPIQGRADIPTETDAHENVKKIPGELIVIPVNESSLKKFNKKNPKSNFVLTNSTGDTIQSGVAIPVTGKVVPCNHHKPLQAFPFRMKDNAILDIQYLDIDQGLASSYIRSILQDKAGNLWFGTAGSGVCKYDGHSFTNFKKDDGLPHNIIWSMMEDSKGNIWFGTFGGGVCKYDGNIFTHFTEKEGLPNDYIVSMLEDKNGNIWLGSNGSGVTKYDGKNFTHYTEAEGLSNNYVYSIIEDKSGNFWFGTKGGGACKLMMSENSLPGQETFIHFGLAEGLNSEYVMALAEDQSGNIWMSTYGEGVIKYDGKSSTRFTEKEGLSSNSVWTIVEDTFGNHWFGTNGAGLNKYDGKTMKQISDAQGLSNKYILSMIEDESGNFWIGTNGGGVCKYNERSFVHATQNEGLSNNRVRAIYEDKAGNIWFGTYGGGVLKYDGETYSNFTQKDGLIDVTILSVFEDKRGNIWFGSNGEGVTKYIPPLAGSKEPGIFIKYSTKNGLASDVVKVIIEDKAGNIWLGTNGGITKISFVNDQEEIITTYTEEEGLPNNFVVAMLEDKSGNIWFGTNGGGIGKIQPKEIAKNESELLTLYSEMEGISNNMILSILEDQFGNIWIGTNGGGITKLVTTANSYSVIYYDEAHGLTNNVVWSLVEDKKGQIYASTENGISLFKLDELNTDPTKTTSFKIFNFKKQDGLKGIDFYVNSVLLDRNNQMWWGSGQCLTMLDLNRFELSDKIPDASLREVEINEKHIDYRNFPDSLKNGMTYANVIPFENYPIDLVLPFEQNHITFYFTALDWKASHKIKYQYKLKGLDDIWNPVTEKNFADYRNIPHGKFIFQVRAMGESQVWGKTFEYSFRILPPWWHTWWFRSLMISAFVMSLYFVYRWRTAALRARQKRLEKIVKERTAEVVSEKNEAQKQRELVEEKHKEITDSINYAERIQRSFLASTELLNENLKDYFVFFQPKDVVSGDFFWASKLANGNFALVTADSTGHGVPGAIMSILNISSLEKSVEIGLTKPAEIFNHTRQTIISRLKKDGSKEGGKDGMDASLICFDFENKKITYAAANNPIWVIRKNSPLLGREPVPNSLREAGGEDGGRPQLIELNPDKMPVGKHDNDQTTFSESEFEIFKGDVIYSLTDGFPDQFGGEKGKKFMYKRLKDFLISIANDPMEIQKEKLNKAFLNWKGDLEQVDDVCVIGVRV